MTTSRKLLLGLLALVLVSVAAPTVASAGTYNTCTPDNIQSIKNGATSYIVFRAVCAGSNIFWWATPADSDGSRIFSSIVMSSLLSGRKLNVECGANSGSCTNFQYRPFFGTAMSPGIENIWYAEAISLQ